MCGYRKCLYKAVVCLQVSAYRRFYYRCLSTGVCPQQCLSTGQICQQESVNRRCLSKEDFYLQEVYVCKYMSTGGVFLQVCPQECLSVRCLSTRKSVYRKCLLTDVCPQGVCLQVSVHRRKLPTGVCLQKCLSAGVPVQEMSAAYKRTLPKEGVCM